MVIFVDDDWFGLIAGILGLHLVIHPLSASLEDLLAVLFPQLDGVCFSVSDQQFVLLAFHADRQLLLSLQQQPSTVL